PSDYVRKQTLANAERYITSSLKEYETLVLGADEKALVLELSIFNDLREQTAAHCKPIQQTASAVAHLDVYSALAEVARARGYCRPAVADGGDTCIKEGRHPVVEL